MAAIFVLTRHTNSFWNIEFYRCYLAVDLFFILSGYVIAHAYDEKLRNGIISVPKFFLIRLIRLYPVFFLSLILCSITLIDRTSLINFENLTEISTVIAMTAFFIPSHLIGRTELFSMNGPYWSLFYELIANMIYAAIRPLLSDLILVAIVICSGLMVIGVSYFHQNLDAGFFFSVKSLVAGFSRSTFGIFTGLLLYRHHVFFEQKLSKLISPWLAFFIIATILISPDASQFNWLIDIIVVCIVFPICVLAASQNKNTKLENVLLALGSASYPIYVLHKPIGEFLSNMTNGIESSYAPMSGVILVLTLTALSIGIEKYYDIPLRRRITTIAFKQNR